jgi:plastocyanin
VVLATVARFAQLWNFVPTPSRSRLALILAAVLAMPLATAARRAPARPAKPATGRIEGQVLLSSTLTARRPRFRIYSDPGPVSRPAPNEAQEMHNVVLYVQNAPVPENIAPARGSIAQKVEFLPHILPIYRGATVDFPNQDDVFHNVFSLSSAATFNLGRFPKGSSKSWVFDKSGTVQVFCQIHADMSAVILVLDNPYFAKPSDAGRYVIEGVPAGEYTVVGWHERIKPVTRTVRVVAGETVKLDFNIPIPAIAEDAGR